MMSFIHSFDAVTRGLPITLFRCCSFGKQCRLLPFLMVIFDYDKADTRKSGLFLFRDDAVKHGLPDVRLSSLIYHVTGSFGITAVRGVSQLLKAFIFLSLFVGFGIKAGVMPFHKWLPYAHSASPSNIRLWCPAWWLSRHLRPGQIPGFCAHPWPLVGRDDFDFRHVSALLAWFMRWKEHDIKKLLAYHSIENIGIILTGIGLILIFQSYGFTDLAILALIGSLFHTLNHALFQEPAVPHDRSCGKMKPVHATSKRWADCWRSCLTPAFCSSLVQYRSLHCPLFNGFVSELMIFSGLLAVFHYQ